MTPKCVFIILVISTMFLLGLLAGLSLQLFDLADAHLIYHHKLSNHVQENPDQTITSSIRARFNEFYGAELVHNQPIDHEHALSPRIKHFYQRYMKSHLGKLSKTFLFDDHNSTVRLLSINQERHKKNSYSNLAFYTLRDERLYQPNLKHEDYDRTWKHCFYQTIDGVIEAASYDKDQNKFAAGFKEPQIGVRFIAYFNDLKCEDEYNIEMPEFYETYCYNSTSSLCPKVNQTNQENNVFEDRWHVVPRNFIPGFNELGDLEDVINPSYDYIPVDSDSPILNIAVEEDLVVYTTLEDKLIINVAQRDSEGDWLNSTLEYPPSFHKYKLHHNLGLGFIVNSHKGERQLLVVELMGTEEKLQLVYFIYKFATGQQIIEHSLYDIYKLNETSEITPDLVYGSVMFELKRVSVQEEFLSLDVLQIYSLPKSVIKTQPRTNKSLVVSLQKYVLQITMEDENDMYSSYLLTSPDSQEYKIKSFDISEDGEEIAYLAYHSHKIKIFVSQNLDGHDFLYMVNFEDAWKQEENTMKEVKWIVNDEREKMLMVVMESGEIAVFEIEFDSSSFGGMHETFFESDLELLSAFSIGFVVFMVLFIKVASNTRLRINTGPRRR